MDLSNKTPKFNPKTPAAASETTELKPQSSTKISDNKNEQNYNNNPNWNRFYRRSSSSSSLDWHLNQNPEIDKGAGVDTRRNKSGSDTANDNSGAAAAGGSTGAIDPDQYDPNRVSNSLVAISVTDTNKRQEFQHYKLIIGESLKKLEQFIENFRSIVETNKHSKQSTTNAMMMAAALETTATTIKLPTPANVDPNDQNVGDLRTVLSEIDQHLSILKEIEQRNTIICETFSKEIRSRDEALLDKMKEITIMNQEMATLQARMQHLVLKNSQLESEVKYLKTISSYTNTETSSTPIMINDEHGGLPRQLANLTTGSTSTSSSLFGALTKMQPVDEQHQWSSSSSKMLEVSGKQAIQTEPMVVVEEGENTIANKISIIQHPQQAAIYHDLLIQYRKIEQLIQQSEVYKIRDTNSDGNFMDDQDVDFPGTNENLIPKPGADDDRNGQTDQAPSTPATAVENFDLESNSSNIMIQQQKMVFDASAESVKIGTSELGTQAPSSPLTPKANLDLNTEQPMDDHPQLDGQPLAQQSQEQQQEEETKEESFGDFNLINNEDVVATSIKAYEHFVKMQHDLEILMRKERDYRSKIIELEKENEELRQKVKDDEYNLSDVQYELDILKHNYELEIESFSTAINERETLIEKLQQKMQSLKARYMKLDERLKAANKIEVELQAQIEELQGRLKYEQLQKQALIDLRISELECKLQQQEQEYRLEIQNLRTDLACKESVCKEMEKKIEDLENSLKSLTSPDFEDEFIYYKNQIDTLIKDLDKEKQEHQRCREQLEQEIRNKDKLLEQAKEQLKKEKDLKTREKAEYEQRMRKMSAKLKAKEEEIKLLHEKILLLSEKFKNPMGKVSENQISQNADHYGQDHGENPNFVQKNNDTQNNTTKRPEQLLTELTLKEIKMNEMKERLEEYEEQLKQLKEQLFVEHDRRRKLETFYLNTLNNNKYSDGDFDDHSSLEDLVYDGLSPKNKHVLQDIDSNNHSSHHHAYHYHHYNGPYHRRDSTSSFALLMDESAIHDRQMAMANVHTTSLDWQQQSYLVQIKRWLRRQKNIFLFGCTKAKLIRILLLVYLIWLHYLAVDYYFGKATVYSAANKAAIVTNTFETIADEAANTGGSDDDGGGGGHLSI